MGDREEEGLSTQMPVRVNYSPTWGPRHSTSSIPSKAEQTHRYTRRYGTYFSISVLCGLKVPVEGVEVLHAELVGANHPKSGSQLVTKLVTHLIQPADQAEGQWHKRYVLLKGTGPREQLYMTSKNLSFFCFCLWYILIFKI
jgi:hypothetical protein